MKIDHNQYILPYLGDGTDYIFQANYRAGMQILEVVDYATADFKEVGYFDIYPSNDNAKFNGAWSVYPWFPSGTVIVSGMSEGLFVLSPQLGPPPPTEAPAPPTEAPVPTEAPPRLGVRLHRLLPCRIVASGFADIAAR